MTLAFLMFGFCVCVREKCDGWVLKGKTITDTLTGNAGAFYRRGTIFRCINLVRCTVVDERLLYPLG